MIKQKTIVLTLSRVFPKTHPNAGEPTRFKERLHNTVTGNKGQWCKLHTIRRNYDLWKVNADKMRDGHFVLSVRQWSARPYNSKQTEIERINRPIAVQRIRLYYDHLQDNILAYIDADHHLDCDIEELAHNDGLTLEQFKDWFFGDARAEHRNEIFDGVVIHWTNLRY